VPIFVPWMDNYGGNRGPEAEPRWGLGALPPKAENQRVKTADDNDAHANFYLMHAERVTGLQHNLGAISM